MRIAIASTGHSLDATVDYHTGRAFCFIVYDTLEEEYTLIENWQCGAQEHWVGTTVADKLLEADVDVALVRHIGPNAFRTLGHHRISVYRCGEWPVVTAIRCYREGALTALDRPNCGGHQHRR